MSERCGRRVQIGKGLLAGVTAAFTALLLGCGEEKGESPLDNSSKFHDLLIVSGNNQTGRPGEPLEQPLTVRAVDENGRPVTGATVRFTVTAGDGTLSAGEDVPAAIKEAVTGSDGRASVNLSLGPSLGLNQVVVTVVGLEGLPPAFTAIAEGEEGEETQPLGAGGLPDVDHFSVVPEKLNIPGGVYSGLSNRITTFVFDAASNPVRSGTVVRFRTSGGGIEESARTDASGRATVVLTTAEPLPEDGWVTVTAETAGEDDSLLTAQTRVLFSGPTVVRLIQPASFAVGAGEAQTFVFFVGDANGNPLAEETTIRVEAAGGTIVGQAVFLIPDTQSVEDTRFSVLFEAAETGEIPQMTIVVTSPNGNETITFISGLTEGEESGGSAQVSDSISLAAADSLLVADGISTTTIRATVLDSAGNGVSNQAVLFTASAGAIDGTALTDAAGQATATYRSAINPEGVREVTVRAQVGEVRAAAVLRLLGVSLELSVSPEEMAADGIAQAAVTATVTTEEGDLIPFVPVHFAATLGTLSAELVETDVTGRASVIYTGVSSPDDLTGVEIRARGAGLDAAVGLRLLGVQVALVASADTVAADGNAQVIIDVRLQRSDGTPIANGIVRFETTLGQLSGEEAETDVEGRAQVILVAGTEAGKGTVKVSYGEGLAAQVAVAFVKGPPASIVVVSVEPPAIGVRGSGANETAIITFEVRDIRGNTVADGEPIFFRLDAPGDGGEQVGPDSTATVDGRVQAALTSGVLARTVRLIAEAPLALGEAIRSTPVPVAIHGGLPDLTHFGLAADPLNLAGRVLFGLESKITAFAFDKYSNPVQPGTSINFHTDGGGVQGAAETNEDGQASVTLFTAEPIPPGPDFLATITGQTVDENGTEIEASTLVLFSGPTAPIRLTGAGADTVEAGRLFIPEREDIIITFRVGDISGNPLMGGSTIEVTSDVAMISGDARITIPDALRDNTDYSIVVADPVPFEDPPQPPKRGSVLIKVESQNGNQQLTFGLTVD